MKQSSRLSNKRTFAALGVASVLAIALTGCLSPGGETSKNADSSPAAQEQSAPSATTSAADERMGETTSRPAATSAAAKPAGATGGGKLTAPGTKLAFGETANTHSNTGKKDSDDYKEASYETKVTKIVAGSEADLAKLKDASKFAGQTPYYVFYESTLTSLSVPTAGMSDPYVKAQLKDGTDAQKLIVFGTMGDCKTGSFETEGKDDSFTYKVGSTKASCSVFLAPAGDSVTTASYEDSGFSYENYGDNEYRDNPIMWGN